MRVSIIILNLLLLIKTGFTQNVGIGTNIPTMALDIVGRMNINQGSSNVFISAGNETLTGNRNLGLGGGSLSNITTGFFNIAIGSEVLRDNTTGGINLGIGSQCLILNTSGSSNVAFGSSALRSNLTGNNNLAIGVEALRTNSSASSNIAIGNAVLFNNQTGGTNIGIGFTSLYQNTVGSDNTAVGSSALYTSSGNGNTAIGNIAGADITTGSYNVIVGSYTGWPIRESSNNVVLADGQGNVRFFANSSGNVGLGELAPSYKLDVNGNVRADTYFFDVSSSLQSSSDQTLKQKIEPMRPILDRIMRLRPVTYEWNDLKRKLLEGRKSQSELSGIYEGLIAQEVEKIFPEYVGKDADGYKTVSYTSFVVPILKAIQEQQSTIDRLNAQIQSLQEMIHQIKMESSSSKPASKKVEAK